MKRKRCFKTILSSLLAAAMLVTAAPADSLLMVSAAQVETLESETTPVSEIGGVLEEQTPGTEVTPENEVPEESTTSETEESTVEDTTESTTVEESTDAEIEAPIEDVTADGIDISSGYWGPTIDYNPDSETAGAVTVYYYGQNFDATVTSVKVKGSWTQSWDDLISMDSAGDNVWSYTFPLETMGLDKSYEYGFTPNSDSGWDVDDCNPNTKGNSKILRNPNMDADSNVTLYYYPEHGTSYPTAVKVKYRKAGTSDAYTEALMEKDSTYTAIYSATLSGLANGDYEYVFDVDGTTVQDTNNAAKTGKFSVKHYPKEDASVVSPKVEGKKVTFSYYNPTHADTQGAEVKLMGTVTDWDVGESMEYNADTGYWTITKEFSAGKYEYKFMVGTTWITDPLNAQQANDNSILYVPGLEDYEAEVVIGESVKLPSSLQVYDDKGVATATAVSYALSEETKKAEWANKITLAKEEDGTSVTLAADFPAETVENFTLTASDGTGNDSVVTVSVVAVKYKYTIYYYDEDHPTVEDAALWIWEEGGKPGVEYSFTEKEKLSDGNEWLKATVELSYTDVSIIPKAKGSWTWQDTDRQYINEDKEKEVTLYIMYEDGAKIYSGAEPPELVVQEKRYLVVEYTRNDGSAQDWNFYTWNSGYGDSVAIPFENKNGTWTAVVPVKQKLESISFCLEKSEGGEHWKDKDGGDYFVSMPADQTVVKVKMEEGKGVTYTYPYNTGYKLAPKEKKIHFYYRNNDAFAAGSTGGFASVQIEIDGTAYNMTWDSTTQRYTYDMENLESRSYKYRYILKETESSDPQYVLDRYNDATVTEGEDEYSVCEYKLFDAEAEAKFLNASMDYEANNVLSIAFKGKDGTDVSEMRASSISADLSSLGGSAEAVVEPELMERTVAVKQGGAYLGEHTIDVTVYDQFGNEYTAQAKVNVVNRNKGSDFDWDEAVIYFAVTDRFFDGNAGNNGIGYNDSELGSSSYHGGDFAGLTQKLDYLQDLGVNTIWITPIVENQTNPNPDDEVGESWGYHGYWAKDFEKLDSHLGTEAEFKALLDAAHARGMKIMVDVVLNHCGYGDDIKDYFNNSFLDEDGNPIKMIRSADEMVNGSDQMSSLSGLQDFLTENKEVRDLLVEWQSKWISKYDIDYYRVDTVKHVDDVTWSAFKNALTKINPNFKMIGEWAGAGYNTTGLLGMGRMDSLLDFDFNDRATNFVTGDIESTESFLTARNAAIDNTATLGAFLSSHDEDGFAYKLINEKGMDETKAHNLALVAASLQLTTKGQVVIYYGEEIGMTGANNYPYQTNRYDFDWSEVNADNATLTHYKAMLAIRNRYSEVLAKGDRATIDADNDNGLDVFSRTYNGTTLRVALNIQDKEQTYTLTGLTAGTVLYDYYATYKTGARKAYTVGADGTIDITIPAAADGGTVVLAAVAPDSDFMVDGATLQEGFDVKPIADHAYTGKNITLSEEELVVYYDGKPLQVKKDYTVSYKNNKTPGTATVTIKGKGNYAGTVTTEFTITKKNIKDDDIAIDYKDLVANNKAQKPLTKITNNGVKLGTKDYTVKYYLLYKNGSRAGGALTSVKGVGTYEMVITGIGNYEGTQTIKVNVISGTYMNKTSITLKWTNAEGQEIAMPKAGIAYTGQAIKPTVEVTKGSGRNKETVLSDCYEIEYINNVEVGTASVKIKGVPAKGYCGEVIKTFKITGVKLSSVAEVDSAKWKANVTLSVDVSGNSAIAVQPEENSESGLLKAKSTAPEGTTLKKDTDYTVTYAKNDKPGTATLTFTGKGKYTGTMKKTFKVDAVDLSGIPKDTADADGSVYTVEASTPYRAGKTGAKAAVTVTYKGAVLEENKDYTLTYSANKAVSTATSKAKVKITGKGAFTGKIENIAFDVTQVDLADLPADISLTAPDAVYTNKAGKYMTVPVLDGTKLTSKNYDLKYFVWENNDWALKDKQYKASTGDRVKIEITPKSAAALKTYTGTGSVEYKVVQANISKAKVTIKAQEYTGKAITLGKSDFSSVKVGNDKLVLGNDFEIVEGSYTNNINKGTASVTIKGIGNYTGEKKVTFKITSRFMTWWWNLFR